jgi:glutamyl-tRNA synthetase
MKIEQKEKLFRIAPTPSGYLHKGNAFAFLLTWLIAKKSGGKILLRIDDLDTERKRPEYLNHIFTTLEKLGIDWDIGPQSPDDFERNWSQRHRTDLYAEAFNKIKNSPLVFGCKYSRKYLHSIASDGQYPESGRYQGVSLSEQDISWRLITPEDRYIQWLELNNDVVENKIRPWEHIRDFIIRKRDGVAAYQLSSVIDDLYFGVTHIIRGIDLIHSTAAQLYLAQILKEYMPTASRFENTYFYHHPLISDNTGSKLSKSAGANAFEPRLDLIWLCQQLAIFLKINKAEAMQSKESLLQEMSNHHFLV